MDGAPELLLDALGRHLALVRSSTAPTEVLRRMLDACRLASPRAAVFLVRKGRLTGWEAVGYAEEAARRLASVSLPAESGWLGRIAADPEDWKSGPHRDESVPDFGQVRFAQAVGVPLRVAGRVSIFLVAERDPGESPWSPELLRLVAEFAAVRLERDVAARTSARGEAEAPLSPEPVEATGADPPGEHATPVVTDLEPVPETDRALPGSLGRREEALRFARLVATDIRLYNEEAVLLGRRHGNLERRLGDLLERGRESFLRRFPEMGPEGLRMLQEAYVQVLAAGEETLLRPPREETGE